MQSALTQINLTRQAADAKVALIEANAGVQSQLLEGRQEVINEEKKLLRE